MKKLLKDEIDEIKEIDENGMLDYCDFAEDLSWRDGMKKFLGKDALKTIEKAGDDFDESSEAWGDYVQAKNSYERDEFLNDLFESAVQKSEEYCHGTYGASDYCEETLFKSPHEGHFVYADGNCMSPYITATGNDSNEWIGGTYVIILTDLQAQEFLKNKAL